MITGYGPKTPDGLDSTSVVSILNSSVAPLSGSGVFTGTWEDVSGYDSVVSAVLTDADGTLSIQFSPDGTNVDSSQDVDIAAAVDEVHRFTVTRRYFRVVFTNGSSPQSYMRLQCAKGEKQILTSLLNSTVHQDADALVSRVITSEISIAEGKFYGYSIVNKFGLNPDVDSGTVPEDIWGGGGAYTGWATSAELLEIFSSDANDDSAGTGARTIRVIGLDSNYDVQSETISLDGTSSVNSVNSYIRVHTATILSAGNGGVNAGVITVRQATTTTNVFIEMQIGRNQSNSSAYTIPSGHTGYLRYLHSSCGKTANVAIEGAIWTRAFGGAFRSRRPFYISDIFSLTDNIYGGLILTEKSDIIVRILSCSANNTPINAGYDLILVKN